MSDPHLFLAEFDDWAHLAASAPETFEDLRLALIEECIREAPPGRRQRLRQLQWRIEGERARSKHPLGACIRISRMMWERVTGPGGLLAYLNALSRGDFEPHHPLPCKKAEILPFRRMER